MPRNKQNGSHNGSSANAKKKNGSLWTGERLGYSSSPSLWPTDDMNSQLGRTDLNCLGASSSKLKKSWCRRFFLQSNCRNILGLPYRPTRRSWNVILFNLRQWIVLVFNLRNRRYTKNERQKRCQEEHRSHRGRVRVKRLNGSIENTFNTLRDWRRINIEFQSFAQPFWLARFFYVDNGKVKCLAS